MKKIIAIIATLLVLGLINSAPIIEPLSLASTAPSVQGQTPDPVRELPGLESLTFYIQNGIFGGSTLFTFAVNSVELMQRRADPLSATYFHKILCGCGCLRACLWLTSNCLNESANRFAKEMPKYFCRQ